MSGTTETRIDTYAENVTVAFKRQFFNVTDEDGSVIKRFQKGKSATMDIGMLFSSEIALTDGENIKLYYTSQGSTTTYLMGSAYIQDRGWNQPGADIVRHDVKIVGRTFGTTS